MTRKYISLFGLLLLCTGWLLAQDSGMGKGQMGKGVSGQMKVEGCLQKSDRGFSLTDASKLTEHVGHEVMVTGTSSSSDSGSSMSSASSEPVLQVTNLKHVSKTCKSAGEMSK